MVKETSVNRDRIFKPAGTDISVSAAIHENPASGIRNHHTSTKIKKTTLVVSIHGSVQRNGTPGARASYSVYFGEGSKYNDAGLLPASTSHKSQNAQLYACQRAIEIVEDVVCKDLVVREVIVKTHSAYLVRCMSEYVGIWEANGWLNAAGKAVVNRVGIERLQDMVREGEEEGRLRIKWWLVGKGENGEGVAAAKEVLTRPSPPVINLEPVPKPWESGMNYWTLIAHTTPAAHTLCVRLGIILRKGSPTSFVGFSAPLRRLVITGEDRPKNFEKLFGPDWAAAITEEWKRIRADVLDGNEGVEAKMLDVGAPFRRPRPRTRAEETEFGVSEGGVRLDLGDELEMMSLEDDSDYVLLEG